MAIIVEDGTGVADANSFVTIVEQRAFATARGFSLPASDAELEPMMIQATDFILLQEARMSGIRTLSQDLPYPRTGVTLYGVLLDPNTIPKALKQAQMQACCDIARGVRLTTDDTAEAVVTHEEIGPIKTTYASSESSQGAAGSLDLFWGFLAPLLRGNGFGLRTVRV